MSYITPRVQIQQEFEQLPVYSSRALSAFIIGPHYHLARYSEPTEKSTTALGIYDGAAVATGNTYQYLVNTTYDIPNVPLGGAADPSYTKVYAENVLANYFPHPQLPATGSAATVTLVAAPSGGNYTNRVRFPNIVLATNSASGRAVDFSARNVSVGDYIDVTGGASTVRAQITALIPDVVASTISNSTADVANNVGALPSAAIGAATYVLSSGFAATTSTAGSVYYGYASKRIVTDTYTVEVTSVATSGAGNLAGAKFSITSASGAFAKKTNQELTTSVLTLDNSVESVGTNDVKISFAGTIGEMLPGSKWTVTVSAAVAAFSNLSTVVKSGVYTGPVDMTYKIVVERGGALYDDTNATNCARLVITASDLDQQTVVLPKKATPFSIGSFGVSASINAGSLTANAGVNNALIQGDVYYISAQAASSGAIRTVQLAETVTTSAIVAAAGNLTAKLYLRQATVRVPAVRDQLLGTTNWTQSGNIITVKSGITSYDPSITAAATPVRLDVVAGNLFVEHRDLLQDNTAAINYVESASDVISKLNTIDPDNALAQGVYDAVLNSANQRVYFLAVGSNDLAGYLAALKIAEKSDQVYSFVPMTFDRDIQEAVVSHVNAFSTPEVARWRIAWLSVKDDATAVTYSQKPTGGSYTATVGDNQLVQDTQFTYVTVQGADFLADDGYGGKKLRANDIMRINFTVNSDGAAVYDEYIVSQVLTNTTFLIATPTPQAYTQAVKVELVRSYTKAERARNIAAIGGGYNNRRVRVVFPDAYKSQSGVVKPGYVAAAGLAGLRSGVVPHQGLTNSEFLGAYDLSKVVIEFGQAELDLMAAAGIWIISQSVIGATAYVRHQLTTDESSLNTSEDSITTNVDSMSYALRDVLAPFIGRYNINNENLTVIRAAITAELNYRSTNTFTTRAGNQLTSFNASDILSLGVDPVSKDKINAEVRLHLPYPLNYLTVKLIGGA